MRSEHATYIPCGACGAALPFDLEAATICCAYCGASQSIDEVVRTRAKAHLDKLRRLEARQFDAAAAVDRYREESRPVVRIAHGLAMLVFFASFFSYIWLTSLVIELLPPLVGVTVAKILYFVLLCGGMIASAWLSILAMKIIPKAKQKTDIHLTPVEIASTRCPQCGATVPVVVEHRVCCPFCETELLADASAIRSEIEAAASQVEETEDQEHAALDAYLAPSKKWFKLVSMLPLFMISFCVGTLLALPLYLLMAHLQIPSIFGFLGHLALVGGLMRIGLAIKRHRS